MNSCRSRAFDEEKGGAEKRRGFTGLEMSDQISSTLSAVRVRRSRSAKRTLMRDCSETDAQRIPNEVRVMSVKKSKKNRETIPGTRRQCRRSGRSAEKGPATAFQEGTFLDLTSPHSPLPLRSHYIINNSTMAFILREIACGLLECFDNIFDEMIFARPCEAAVAHWCPGAGYGTEGPNG